MAANKPVRKASSLLESTGPRDTLDHKGFSYVSADYGTSSKDDIRSSILQFWSSRQQTVSSHV